MKNSENLIEKAKQLQSYKVIGRKMGEKTVKHRKEAIK